MSNRKEDTLITSHKVLDRYLKEFPLPKVEILERDQIGFSGKIGNKTDRFDFPFRGGAFAEIAQNEPSAYAHLV